MIHRLGSLYITKKSCVEDLSCSMKLTVILLNKFWFSRCSFFELWNRRICWNSECTGLSLTTASLVFIKMSWNKYTFLRVWPDKKINLFGENIKQIINYLNAWILDSCFCARWDCFSTFFTMQVCSFDWPVLELFSTLDSSEWFRGLQHLCLWGWFWSG